MALAPSVRSPPGPRALRLLPCPKPLSTSTINILQHQPQAHSSAFHAPAAARGLATFRQRCAVRTRVAEAPIPSLQETNPTWSVPAGIDLAAYPSMSGRHVLITGTSCSTGQPHCRHFTGACHRGMHHTCACKPLLLLPWPHSHILPCILDNQAEGGCQSCKRCTRSIPCTSLAALSPHHLPHTPAHFIVPTKGI